MPEQQKSHRVYEYPCEECGEMMTTARRDRRFCSRACTRKGQAERAKVTGGRPAKYELTCDWCGQQFMNPRPEARWCSKSCRGKGYYYEDRERSVARNRAQVAANPEKRKATLARFAANHPDYGKQQYARIKADPERLAASKARSRQYYLDHRNEALERSKRQRERNPTKMYSYKHGCDWDELIAGLWHAQDGKCYLCGDQMDLDEYRAVQLDHDHSCCPLGRSCVNCRRGLACSHCNKLIGLAQDDPDRLRRIADGLEAANALVRQRMKDANLEKRGILFDLDEAG